MSNPRSALPTPCNSKPLYLCPTSPTKVPSPIRRLLIANRGEIAARIIQTCNQLSIETVLVYASPDAYSPHVKSSTLSVSLGPINPIQQDGQPGLNPYMNPNLLIKVALDNHCDALHPGYGYLSENPDFADAVANTSLPWSDNGEKLKFLGPNGTVMREMGDKSSSKRLLRSRMGKEAPLVPGYEGNGEKDQEIDNLYKEGINVGFPIMIKASAGGGGRGMRIVWEEKNLRSELERARSESIRSFASPVLLLERYVAGGKHIEVQIFGDSHGNVISFGERECSVQRRHQKVIEESPSPALFGKDELRRKLHESAVKIGKLLNYQGAATMEFIFDSKKDEFFFLEINTRLQVEHPVTEMVWGIDLVSLQVFIAAGGDLTTLPEISSAKPFGHSIELRICSEEPGTDFSPKTGLVRFLDFPFQNQPGFRLDTGIETSSQVSIHFDPMLSKLIIHSLDRESCIEKTLFALRTTPILGVVTNTSFLSSCLDDAKLRDGTYSTSMIPEGMEKLLDRARGIALHQLVVRPDPSISSKMSLEDSVPLQSIIPAFLFFYKLRELLRPGRVGLNPTFRLHDSDSSQVSAEIFEAHLPDNLASWSVVLEYKKVEKLEEGSSLQAPGNENEDGTEFQIKVWLNKGDEIEKETLKMNLEKAKKKAEKSGKSSAFDEKKFKNDLISKRSANTARYYASRSSRSGLEGREDGPDSWKFGATSNEILNSKVILHSSEQDFKFHSNQSPNPNSSLDLNPETWSTANIRASIDGKTSNHLIASDGRYDRHEREAQEAWIWVPALAGQVKVVRRGLRVWAGRLENKAGGGGNDDLTYTTPMPCKILQLLSEDGASVKQGDGILVMESMKTEVTVRAKTDGTLKINVKEGETLGEGAELCSVDPE